MKLPCDTCKGQCCGPVPFSKRQYKGMKKAGLVPKGVKAIELMGGVAIVKKKDLAICGFLIKGKCSIYKYRPRICRMMGEDKELPCPVVEPEEAMSLYTGRLDEVLK